MDLSIQTEFKAEAKYSICSNICSVTYVDIQILITVFRCTVHNFLVIHCRFSTILFIIALFCYKNALIYFMNYQKSFKILCELYINMKTLLNT